MLTNKTSLTFTSIKLPSIHVNYLDLNISLNHYTIRGITEYTTVFTKNHTTSTRYIHDTFLQVSLKPKLHATFDCLLLLTTLTTSTKFLDSDYKHWTTPHLLSTPVPSPGCRTHYTKDGRQTDSNTLKRLTVTRLFTTGLNATSTSVLTKLYNKFCANITICTLSFAKHIAILKNYSIRC